ncbi:hypothetical protein HDU96_003249 [Phlyctochytrium bullatum]|nr:hypothetical protein HDU96_003249 [Phlyctochytrium bullatum]
MATIATDGGPPPPKINPRKTSCESCRIRKFKCDGHAPGCEKKGVAAKSISGPLKLAPKASLKNKPNLFPQLLQQTQRTAKTGTMTVVPKGNKRHGQNEYEVTKEEWERRLAALLRPPSYRDPLDSLVDLMEKVHVSFAIDDEKAGKDQWRLSKHLEEGGTIHSALAGSFGKLLGERKPEQEWENLWVQRMIIEKYHERHADFDRSNLCLQVADRMVDYLKLDQDPDDDPVLSKRLSWEEKETRRRCFWTVTFMTRTVYMAAGLPTLRIDRVGNVKPMADSRLFYSLTPPLDPPPKPDSYINLVMQAIGFGARLQAALGMKPFLSAEELNAASKEIIQTDGALRDWIRNLPEDIRGEPSEAFIELGLRSFAQNLSMQLDGEWNPAMLPTMMRMCGAAYEEVSTAVFISVLVRGLGLLSHRPWLMLYAGNYPLPDKDSTDARRLFHVLVETDQLLDSVAGICSRLLRACEKVEAELSATTLATYFGTSSNHPLLSGFLHIFFSFAVILSCVAIQDSTLVVRRLVVDDGSRLQDFVLKRFSHLTVFSQILDAEGIIWRVPPDMKAFIGVLMDGLLDTKRLEELKDALGHRETIAPANRPVLVAKEGTTSLNCI